MLKADTLKKFAGLLKIDETKLKAAIADEKEVDLDVADGLVVYTAPELDTFQKNKYEAGKKAGADLVISDLKKKHGVEVAGEDPEKFVEGLTLKVKKEIETNPDERIKEKDKTIETHKKALKEANERADRAEQEKQQYQGDSKLLSMLPNNRLDILNNEEYLTLVKSSIQLKTVDGKEVAVRGGQVLTDPKTLEPIAPADAIKTFFTEKRLVKPEEESIKGRGGVNSNPGGGGGGGKYAKLSELQKHLEDEGINPNGSEANARIQAAVKENPEMDLRS